MSVPGKLLQHCLMFAGKPEAYPSEALFKYSAIGWLPSLTHKHLTRLEMHAGDKHSSLLHKFVNNGCEKLAPGRLQDLVTRNTLAYQFE